MSEALIQLSGVSKTYTGSGHEVKAVQNISLSVEAGEMVAIYGPSGSGKSTLLLMAGSLLRPDSGTVQIANRDPYAADAGQRARFRADHIGFIFQQFHLLPYLNVIQNVRVVEMARPVPNAKSRAADLLDRLGLADRMTHLPSALSVGEKQRVAAARAMLGDPPVIMADEPTGNLDEENGEMLVDALTTFAAEGKAVLAVTHDRLLRDRATRTLALRGGCDEAARDEGEGQGTRR